MNEITGFLSIALPRSDIKFDCRITPIFNHVPCFVFFLFFLQKEKLATIEERYREEMALSARAHHLCELNEQEARRFHVLGERYRAAIMSFLSRLENRGLIELRGLLEHDASSDGVTSTSFEIAQELNSVCSQLVLGGERLNVSLQHCIEAAGT